jgi:UDP-glucose 4-epimerase
MTKVLVTGGAGFIASHVCDELIEQGYEVVVVDNLVTGFKENINPKAKFYEVDIRDADKITAVFDKEKPDYVNHHAAQMDVRKSTKDPVYDAQCNILGSLNLIINARKNKIKKFVYISTGGAVYGNVRKEELPIKENHRVNPICQYGISKHTVEHYLFLEKYLYDKDYIVLRYPNVFGPRQDPHGEAGVNAIFIGQMLKNQSCKIFGDGTKTRDYVYVKDIVRANLLAMKSDFNGILNLGSGIETSDQEVFDTCKNATGYNKEPIYEDARPGEIQNICLDASRAKEVLGWKPEYTYEDGVKETVPFYKEKLNIK